ncbi:MAG TPA: hypothetical protein VMT58_07700 [Candidatus Binataceae bacterium]|nr:hypothetical protein [Candidatus Binataceae bacterium]
MLDALIFGLRVFAAVVVVGVFLIGLQLWSRYVCQYRLNERGFEVLLFGGMPIVRIGLSEIIGVRVAPPAEQYKPWVGFPSGNRLWGDCVVITKKRGFWRSVIVTPDDPTEFVNQLKELLRNREAALNTPYLPTEVQ